jgi:hypothetical protein
MPRRRPILTEQIAELTELIRENQAELRRISAQQERILAAVTPDKPPLKFVILTPPMSYEYFDSYLKVQPREWEAIVAGRSVCVIGDGYSFEGELEAQDYWLFKGGVKRGRLKVLMRELFDNDNPDHWNPKSWEEAFDGRMEEVTIDEFDENEALGVNL